MRIAGQIILGVLVLLLGIASFRAVIPLNGFTLEASKVPPEILHASRGINIYQLETNKYLKFPLLTTTQVVRIATNADFSDSMDLRESSIREPYQIEVQAFDIHGALLETKTVNYFTKTRFYFEKDWGMYLPSFYLDSASIPSETRVSTLNFRDTSNVAQIRLRRIDNNTNLKTIYARVYQPAGIGRTVLDFFWFNLMPKDRERLASANIYPSSMIRKDERRNLIKNLWNAVAPAGVPGEDYFERSLYSVNNPKGIPYDLELLHSGNYVDDNHQLIVPVGEDGSNLKIEIISADIIYPKYMKIWLGEPDNSISSILKYMKPEEPEAQGKKNNSNSPVQFVKGQNIELLWKGQGIGESIAHKETIKDRYFTKEYQFNYGLLAISANAPAYVNITKKTPAGEEPIILQPTSVNLLQLQPDSPLIYDIYEDAGFLTSFRVDFRRISNKVFDQATGGKVEYEILAADSTVIAVGVIKISQPITKFDFALRKGNLYVSEKQRHYFCFSKGARIIKFKGPEDIFISLYNRPDNLMRNYLIPDDYKSAESRIESLRRTWFYKTPRDYNNLRNNQRTVIIKTQPRMITEDTQVLAGLYDWEEIFPQGSDWSSINITETKNPKVPSRRESEGTEFSPVSVNQEQQIEITGSLGEVYVRPKIVYSGLLGTRLNIYLDKKAILETELKTTVGELQLPNVSIGQHTILINADNPARVLINQNKNDYLSSLKRHAVFYKSKSHTYIVKKTDNLDKILTLKIYSLDNKSKKLSVIVEAEPVNVDQSIASYTIKKRQYNISFSDGKNNVALLDDNNRDLFAADPIFIKLGEDLSRGEYRINITSAEEEKIYVSLSSLTSGLINKRVISTEEKNESQ